MYLKFFEEPSKNTLLQTLKEVEETTVYKSVMILATANLEMTSDDFLNVLNSLHIKVFGGLFPQVVFEDKSFETGLIVVAMEQDVELIKLENISDPDFNLEDFIDPELSIDFNTIFVFIDGLAKGISNVINELFNEFGLDVNYIGGGSGSMSMQQEPCLFTNDSFFDDGAILALMTTQSGIGVSHGWKDLTGPFKITDSFQNVIKAINGEPAFELYKRVIAQYTDLEITEEAFYDIAKSYPFGITMLDDHRIVRDPIKVVDGKYLECVGNVPNGSFVYILSGNRDDLLAAAKEALKKGEMNYNGSDQKSYIFIDCISRALYLKESFLYEVTTVYHPEYQMFGALTLGEISNTGKEYLEYYNKTIVVGVIES